MVVTVNSVNPDAASLSERHHYRFGGEFFVVSRSVAQSMADGDLGMSPRLRVLGLLLLRCKRRNRVEDTQARIGELLGISQSHVSEAFRELAQQGFVIRVKETSGRTFWYLDARRVFHGAAKDHPASLERQARQRERDRRSNVVSLHSPT